MKVCVVFCSIRASQSFSSYADNFRKYGHNPDVLIVDENGDTRGHIQKALEGFHVEFYGIKERHIWLHKNGVDSKLIPNKTTDVVGFSLLIVYPRNYDMIVFLDDDTYPAPNQDFLGEHYRNLFEKQMCVRHGMNGWVNPHPYFSRGYPYSLRHNYGSSAYTENHPPVVLNMGLWLNVPDLNALDYLYGGSLTGQISHSGLLDYESYVVRNSHFPLSRMNIAFKPKIVPAFYQGTGNVYGVGRYGDVFSGLFLAKIANRLGECISYGTPLCIHNKEPRDVFHDIACELEAIKLNETLWKVLDKIAVDGKSYAECYLSLVNGLLGFKNVFHNPNYISYLAEKMYGWVNALEA